MKQKPLLTREQIEEARRLRADKVSFRELAGRFKVSEPVIVKYLATDVWAAFEARLPQDQDDFVRDAELALAQAREFVAPMLAQRRSDMGFRRLALAYAALALKAKYPERTNGSISTALDPGMPRGRRSYFHQEANELRASGRTWNEDHAKAVARAIGVELPALAGLEKLERPGLPPLERDPRIRFEGGRYVFRPEPLPPIGQITERYFRRNRPSAVPVTASLMGDPPPGRSALAEREGRAP